jgi:hypothetical protein
MKHLATALLFSIFLIPVASAQTVLRPGETNFTVDAIILDPVTDYAGVNEIGLAGDVNYLNIKWNATYDSGEERDIGVKCYLNCPDPLPDIDVKCAPYQACSYLGPTGVRICTIPTPNYLFKNINNITCKFYDPLNPSIDYIPRECLPFKCYINRTFWPINFSLSAAPAKIEITVGKSFILPIDVKNFGLLKSNFTVNTTALKPEIASIDNSVTATETLGYGQIGRVYPRITLLYSDALTLKILAKSGIEPVPNFDTSCSVNSDCSHYGSAECMNNRCWKRLDVQISAGNASLPEFDITGVIQILLLAALALVFIKL